MLIQDIAGIQPFLVRHDDRNTPAFTFLQRHPMDMPACIYQAILQFAGPLPNSIAADIHLAELRSSDADSIPHPVRRRIPPQDCLALIVEPSSPLVQHPPAPWLPPQDAFRCAMRIPFHPIASWYETTHRAFAVDFDGITILSAAETFWDRLRPPLTRHLDSNPDCILWPTSEPLPHDPIPTIPPAPVDRVPLIDLPSGTPVRVACFEGGESTLRALSGILQTHLPAVLRASPGDFPQPGPYRRPPGDPT